jgi:hypothetical protein
VTPPPLPAALVARLTGEVARHESRYGPFPPTGAGLRQATACLQDETAETLEAWRAGRAQGWRPLGGEALQATAVAIRLAGALDQEPTRP